MRSPDIQDIVAEFEGQDLGKYGLFPLFAWYLKSFSCPIILHKSQRTENKIITTKDAGEMTLKKNRVFTR